MVLHVRVEVQLVSEKQISPLQPSVGQRSKASRVSIAFKLDI